MIRRFCGAGDTALYSLAHQCAIIIMAFLSVMNMDFSLWLGEKIHEKRYDEIKFVSRIYVMILVVPAIGLLLISPEILFIPGDTEYMAVKYVMPSLTLRCVCQFLYTLYANVEQFEKKIAGIAMATMVAAAVNGVLNYLLVLKLGLTIVYDNRFVALAIILMSLAAAGINFLYHLN